MSVTRPRKPHWRDLPAKRRRFVIGTLLSKVDNCEFYLNEYPARAAEYRMAEEIEAYRAAISALRDAAKARKGKRRK